MDNKQPKEIILIGAGILSTTFGSFLKNVEPDWNIKLFERLDQPAIESSNEKITLVLVMQLYVSLTIQWIKKMVLLM